MTKEEAIFNSNKLTLNDNATIIILICVKTFQEKVAYKICAVLFSAERVCYIIWG